MSVTRGIGVPGAGAVAGSGGALPCRQRRIEQPVGVVEGRAEHLAARNILEGRGDPPLHLHRAGVDRLRSSPKRGSVARNARARKIASIRSPRACLIASAASSRSYSEPSAITRSTASESCSEIWSSDSSGTLGSPRRSCASSRWAFSMARSPPLTATYMAQASIGVTRVVRGSAATPSLADQNEIDATRKYLLILRQPRRRGRSAGRSRGESRCP